MNPVRGIRINYGKESRIQVYLEVPYEEGGWVLPIMAYIGRLPPKGAPFSGLRYMNG